MKHIKLWLTTMAVLLCSVTASAHDFVVGGIYYSITSSSDLTVAVTYRGNSYSQYSDEYSGAVIIPSTVTYNSKTYSVTSIGNEAFRDCSSLTAINIPKDMTSIGGRAFYNCWRLTIITIPENSQLTSIEERAFQYSNSLTSITIPKSVTSIGDYAFYECSKLTTITIPEGVTSIGGHAFYNCSSLTSITLPEGVTSIGGYAFYHCGNLTSITLPESVTTIEKLAFCGCSSLTAITIPESVTSIGDEAFEECSSLTAINIPKGVTSIASGAFCACSSLTTITIPESVKSIGIIAFGHCPKLLDVYCYAETVPSANTNAFYGSSPENITLHVLASALETYKTTAPWSSFGKFEVLTPRSVTLTINQYGSGTYCSEYALDFSEIEGLKAYAATGYNTRTGVVTLTRVMTAKAGEGLFIKGEPGDYMVPVMEDTDDNTLNMLVGTLTNTDLNGTSTDGLYTNYKYTIKVGDAEPMFYQFDDGSTLAAERAYLQIPTRWLPQAESKAIRLRFVNSETTDIEEIESTENDEQSTAIYDLIGRRVENPSKGCVYIVNGCKVIY